MGVPETEVLLRPYFNRELVAAAVNMARPKMLAHLRSDLPNECVGLLYVNGYTIELINQARSPERFSVGEKQFTDAIMSTDLEFVGIYHSHPLGNREFSAADLEAFMEQRKNGYPFVSMVIVPDGTVSVLGSREEDLNIYETYVLEVT